MRYKQARTFIGREKIFNPRDHFHIQMVGRFIQQKQIGFRDNAPRQHDTPPFAAGKQRTFFLRIIQIELCKDCLNLVCRIPRIMICQEMFKPLMFRGRRRKFLIAFEHAGEILDTFSRDRADRCIGIQRKILRHIGDTDVLRHRDFTRGQRVKPGNDLHQGRLAASVAPDQSHTFAVIDGKRSVVEQNLTPDFKPEMLACPENPVRHLRTGHFSERSSSMRIVRFSFRERSAANTMR